MKLRTLVAATLGALLVSVASGAPADPDSSQGSLEPAQRELWARGSERFVRQWLATEPLSAEIAKTLDPAQLQPAAGQELTPAAPGIRWVARTSWSDVTDLAITPRDPQADATPVDQFVFVAASLPSKAGGAMDISIGSESAYSMWLNGRWVHSQVAATYQTDRQRLPVELQPGDNLVLLKFHQTSSGPSPFSLRAVAPGAALKPIEEISPSVMPTTDDTLLVRTHPTPMPRSATVTLEVIAAGGEIIERQTSARGEVAKFNTQKWKDGAYEIRLSTQTAWKQPQVRFLPWYKGDAIAAVRELLAAAETAKADVAGDTVRMLAAMAKDRLGGSLDKASPASWWRVQPTLMEFQELQLEAQGVKARARANGFFRLAYRDDADGSTQFCRAYLPDGYESDMAWPLILSLHGYNPDNPAYVDWWRSDQRHHPIAVTKPSIYVEPHGRGNAQYLGLGDRDVMRCLDEAKRQFSVDPDRVYLTGESMGGHGTWAVVTRHPDVFAAAAPVFGGWDFRVTNVGGPSLLPPPQTPMEAFALERSSSFANAESLLNVPLLIVHGDADRAVSVENSRHVVRMLQRWGYDIRYHEMPGWVHEDLGQQGTIADWLLTHRRVSEPKSVRLRTTDLSYAGAYWLRVDSMENPGEVIRVSADVLQPGVVRIDSTNAASLSLDLPASLRGDAEKLRVVWNGEAHELNARDSGAIELGAKAPASGLRKRAGLEGPLPAAIATPFAVVIGTTSPDPQMREAIQRAADSLARQWQSWQHTSLRVLKDTQVTADHEKAYSLLLIGGADANAVSRRLGRKLPFATSRAGITVDGRQWKVEDAVLQAIYPNPSATDRYVYVVAATSAAGMYFWKPQLVHFPRGHPLTAFDWIIQDGRRPPVGTVNPAIAFVAAGIFDTTWHVQDRWTVARDPKVAAGWTLRRAPPPGFTPSAGELAALAGRYELFPGLVVNFRVDGTALIAESPRGVVTLVSEGERVFVNHSSGDSVEFVRDAGGNISGIAVEDNGAVLWAKRLP